MTDDENNALDALTLQHDDRQGETVLQSVYDFLGRFVAYPNEHAHVAHALWCAHAHLMDVWETTPRIGFLSAEPASGKSRALEITELLVPNPVLTVNVSPAYIFRKVGADGGSTILYDEIDTVFGPKAKDNEEIRGLLNAGYRKGATAGRCVVKGNLIETEELPAYAAVALAGLGWLPDTILTRSVIVRMRRRLPGETVEPFRQRIHTAEGHAVRSRLELWARSIKDAVDWPELPAEIVDRNADCWEPLVAVADAAGGVWPDLARKAAVALVAAAQDQEPTLGVQLLQDCRTAFGESKEMPTKLLIVALTSMPESPWGNLRGQPLDDRGLAHRLRQYSIKPGVIRIGELTQRGYKRQDFLDAWQRYLPSGECVTGVTTETQMASVTDVSDVSDLPDAEGWSFHLGAEQTRP
jgi:hypothetical protein